MRRQRNNGRTKWNERNIRRQNGTKGTMEDKMKLKEQCEDKRNERNNRKTKGTKGTMEYK